MAKARPIATFAGKWQWSLAISCRATSRNPRACIEMLTLGVHVYDLKGSQLSFQGIDYLTVDRAGHFTEHGSGIVSGESPEGAPLKSCDPNVMESRPFRGTCHVSWKGDGSIRSGGTFKRDFYTGSGRLTFPDGKAKYTQSYTDIGDSFIPALPGDYTTHHYLSLVGEPKFMQGITVHLTVRHLSDS